MATQTLPHSPPPIFPLGPAHEMRITDKSGDMKIQWDPTKPEEVATAKLSFDTWNKKGYAAYKMDASGNKGEVIREFDPDAKKIILAPAMVGG